MNPALTHLGKYPKARASTLAYLIVRQATTEKLAKEYDAWLTKQLLASLRTLPINVKRAHAAGRL